MNLSNIPSENSEELRQTQIINQYIFKYLENEILLTPYSHRKAIEESLKSQQQIFYFDLYKPEALSDNKNLVSPNFKSFDSRFYFQNAYCSKWINNPKR